MAVVAKENKNVFRLFYICIWFCCHPVNALKIEVKTSNFWSDCMGFYVGYCSIVLVWLLSMIWHTTDNTHCGSSLITSYSVPFQNLNT